MALQKVTYISEETVISAENLNDIQDAIIKVEDTVDKGVVPTARTINGKPLSTDISLSANDVGAAPAGFGLGTTGLLTNDWNAAVKSGFYYGNKNSPDGGWWAGAVYGNSNNYAFQHLFKSDNPSLHRIRELANGTWGSWIDCGPSAFAPAGFGYGEPLAVYSVETEAELETTLLEILNTMSNYTTKQVRINLGFLGVNTYYLTTIYRHTSVYALVTFQTMRFIGASLLKAYVNGTWNAICWENPPMNLGVEYRTTERWNGKAVYTKLIDFGALPNASSKTVATNVPTTYVVRSEHVIHSSDGKVIQSPYFLANGTLVVKHLVTGSGIQITTTADYSGYIATFQIWYTKEDWK